MTDRAQIIREALGRYWEAMEMVDLTDEVDPALAALDALEAALQDAVEVAEEAVADADRKTEVLRKIADGTHLVDHFYEGPECRCGQQYARAALSEDE